MSLTRGTVQFAVRRPRTAVSIQLTAASRDLRSADCEVQALMLWGRRPRVADFRSSRVAGRGSRGSGRVQPPADSSQQSAAVCDLRIAICDLRPADCDLRSADRQTPRNVTVTLYNACTYTYTEQYNTIQYNNTNTEREYIA